MKQQVCIIGAGGHGRVVLDILEQGDQYTVQGFVDDSLAVGTEVNGYPVLGTVDELITNQLAQVAIIGIGNNHVRKQIYHRLKEAGISMINAIHPTAIINTHVSMGIGNVIAAGAIINSNSQIGNNNIINTGATLDHDNLVMDHAHVSPGVHCGGNVTISNLVHVGIGATVLPATTIGNNSVVGGGAVVIDQIPAGKVVVGVPAKVIKNV